MRRPGARRCHRFKLIEVFGSIIASSFGSVSALSESPSKSACSFPMTSSADLVLVSSVSNRSLRRRSRSSSTCSGRPTSPSPSAPAPAGRRHREPCATPPDASCRGPRGAATRPRSLEPTGNASYSSRISALYSAVNDRRRGRAAGSGSSTTPSWARASRDAVVMVIGSTSSRLALQGWSATAGVSRQPDRQGLPGGLRRVNDPRARPDPTEATARPLPTVAGPQGSAAPSRANLRPWQATPPRV